MTLHTYNPQLMSLPNINFLHLTVSKIQPRQDFIGQGQRSNQVHTMTLHTYNPLPTPYDFRDTEVGQDFIGQGHYGKVKGQTKVRP